MSESAQVEHILQQGVRDLWYPVLSSWEVADVPVGITRLGQNLAVWRDEAGNVHAIEDRCPHRGARLSLGWNLGDRLGCWYHGVEVNNEGFVIDVPAIEKNNMVGRQCVRSYPAVEKHGAVFVWFGTDLNATPEPLQLPEQLESDEWSNFLCSAEWACHYQYAIDNVMDPMHGSYLHAKSHSMYQGNSRARLREEATDTGFIFAKEGQTGVNFDWVEVGFSSSVWLRLSIPYQKKYGPGGSFWIIGLVTPVDANHCRVFFWRCRQVDDWEKASWRFLYRHTLETLHWDVLVQDQVILENLAPDANTQERLYQHDVGLSRFRRRLTAMAQKQAERVPND